MQPQTRESPQANEQTKENIGLGRINRVVGRSENSGVPVLFGGHNLPPLVEIGLTDLPKFGVVMAPLASPGTTGLIKDERSCCSLPLILFC